MTSAKEEWVPSRADKVLAGEGRWIECGRSRNWCLYHRLSLSCYIFVEFYDSNSSHYWKIASFLKMPWIALTFQFNVIVDCWRTDIESYGQTLCPFVHSFLSDLDWTWYVGRSRWVMHGAEFFLDSQSQGRGHGVPHFVKYGPTPNRLAPRGSTKANGGFDIMSPRDPL